MDPVELIKSKTTGEDEIRTSVVHVGLGNLFDDVGMSYGSIVTKYLVAGHFGDRTDKRKAKAKRPQMHPFCPSYQLTEPLLHH